ncbi:MAG: type II toxin-antitoxin system VapC family toxin [Nitrososphaeria archaeon]|nr:type II toxin-antitoxin system VapC family toxin [Nitrososphaeria archaeon]
MYYLDTSALVKRYVSEVGSNIVDEVFKDAYRGVKVLSFSYWNIAEAFVVFDKYERGLGLDAKKLLRDMLREAKTLLRLRKLLVIGISPSILRNSIELVLKHHMYVADALQIVSARRANSSILVTGDRRLAVIAEKEGLKILCIGNR